MKYQIDGFCESVIVTCTELSAFRLIKNAMLESLQYDIDDECAEERIREIAQELLNEVLQADSIDDLRLTADIYEV